MSRAVRKTDRDWPGRSPIHLPARQKTHFSGSTSRTARFAFSVLGSVRPGWRGRALETDGAGTQKLRLLHPVASAPLEYPIWLRWCARDLIARLTLFGRWGGPLLFPKRTVRIARSGVPRLTNNICETTNKRLRRNTVSSSLRSCTWVHVDPKAILP